jgi:hypothetical protein
MQAGLGPVGLGHRDQLGHVQAVPGAFAHEGGGVLVAVTGGRGHGQPEAMSGWRQPTRLRWWLGQPQGVAVGVGGWLDRQVPLEAAQGLLAGLLATCSSDGRR